MAISKFNCLIFLAYLLTNKVLGIVSRPINRWLLISFSAKETIIMSENNKFLDDDEIFVEQMPRQTNANSADTSMGNALAKIALGAAIGATLGAIAAALANRDTAQRVNLAVKTVGNAVKNAADGVNQTVKDVGNGIKNVAESVNETVKDVGDSVKVSAEGVSETVKVTMDSVKGTAEGVNDTLKGTMDTVKGVADDVNNSVKGTGEVLKTVGDDVNPSGNQATKPSEKQITYILVPVEKE
jgi:gas vesicle protein